jgi:hypothetical protein
MAPRKADNLQHNMFVFNVLRFIPAIVRAVNTSASSISVYMAFKLLQLNEKEWIQTDSMIFNSNRTMKNLSKTMLALLATGVLGCAVFSQQAQAIPIDGNINFVGAVQLDNNNLALATTVNIWFDVFNNPGQSTVAPGATGNFSGIPAGTSATMAQPWIFNPSTPTPDLWSVGGFTFELLTATVVTQTANFLNVLGTGTISGNGFDPTAATWGFTINNSDGLPHLIFSFGGDSSTRTSVPDGGSAVALLGLAFIGIEVLRRKLRST